MKVAIVKPGKLAKVVAKDLGDTADVDLFVLPTTFDGPVTTVYEVTNTATGSSPFGDVVRMCTRFSAADAGPCVFGFAIPSYASAGQEESSAWRLARVATREPPRLPAQSRAFPDGGYFVLRSGTTATDALQLAFDAGPFGLPIDPHHGHADALSFDLYALGRVWLVDSGVYSTHAPWPWRRC